MFNNWNNVSSDTRNDLVFEGRNQAYGAYPIRKEYNKRITFIVCGLLVLSIALSGLKYLLDNKKDDALDKDVKLDVTQIDLTPPAEKNEPPPPPPPPPPPVAETIKFVPPVIKEDAHEDEPPPPQEKVAETNVGTTTQAGSGEDVVVPGDGDGKAGPVEEKAPEIFTVVEQMPEFPGGPAEMMKYIQKNIHYPEVAKEAGIQGRCFVKFVVESDGSISNVEVLKGVTGGADCDKEAMRVVKSMPKWSAGKQNGRSVRVWFNLPIVFRLQ
ncbi:MAG: energy transducer TonB [Bacteroidetes bacterium]|nr:energy transducer TonB [Bacteroidota bacterium]